MQRTVWLNAWKAPSLASTVVVTCWVYDDPNIVFEGQAGGSSTTGLLQADVGNNVNFGGQSTPNSAGFSQAYFDQTTLNPATTTLPFRLIGMSQKVGNDPLSAYDTVEAVFNFSQIKSTTGV